MAKTRKNSKIIYKQLRLKSDFTTTYEQMLNAFGVECDFLKDQESVEIGFSPSKQEKLIGCFLNSGWNLVAVSEDEKTICFHMTKQVEDETL